MPIAIEISVLFLLWNSNTFNVEMDFFYLLEELFSIYCRDNYFLWFLSLAGFVLNIHLSLRMEIVWIYMIFLEKFDSWENFCCWRCVKWWGCALGILWFLLLYSWWLKILTDLKRFRSNERLISLIIEFPGIVVVWFKKGFWKFVKIIGFRSVKLSLAGGVSSDFLKLSISTLSQTNRIKKTLCRPLHFQEIEKFASIKHFPCHKINHN